MGKTLRRNNDKCVVKQNWLNYGGFCGLSPQPSYKQVVIAINKNRSYPLQPMSNRWKNNKVFNKNISHRFFSYLFSRVENLWYFFLLPSARNDWKLEQHLMLENIPSKICSMKREFPPSDSFIPFLPSFLQILRHSQRVLIFFLLRLDSSFFCFLWSFNNP